MSDEAGCSADLIECKVESRMGRNAISAIFNDERIRFLAVGGFNTLFGFATYSALYYFLGSFVHYLLLATVSHFASVVVAFALYRRHVFKSQGHVFKEFIRYNISVFANLCFGLAVLAVLVDVLGIRPVAAQAIVTILLVLANFIAHKYFTFRRGKG